MTFNTWFVCVIFVACYRAHCISRETISQLTYFFGAASVFLTFRLYHTEAEVSNGICLFYVFFKGFSLYQLFSAHKYYKRTVFLLKELSYLALTDIRIRRCFFDCQGRLFPNWDFLHSITSSIFSSPYLATHTLYKSMARVIRPTPPIRGVTLISSIS